MIQTDREIAALRSDLSRLEGERDAVRAELEGVHTEHQTSVRLYANMQGFGDSFVALQKSQATAAQALREEKQHAIEAASVS
ncbi:MAG TPA: chemotaxis protein, partial [Gallionella sp.]|nr:chemotaxis protein [Gallionella sp.]